MKKIKNYLKRFKVFVYLNKAIKLMHKKGIRFFFKAIKCKLLKQPINESQLYKHLFLSKEERTKQRNTKFANEPLISILVPLYQTPEKYLKEMLTSVQIQTYEHWELILADASNVSLESIVQGYNESRFHYVRLKHNDGIVGNTNEAYRMAKGSYIGCLDHDDILGEGCLYEIVKRINEENADIIYTDEITFKDKIMQSYQPNLKPDFSIDTLRSYNYICHFTCFKKSLLDYGELPFRKQAEGSQDYDLILRLIDRTFRISHIDRVLYFWRAHEQSTAQSIEAKPYTMDAAKFALTEHLQRRGLCGVVKNAKIPTTYKIEYEITSAPLISILIPNKDHVHDLQNCLTSILQKSTYQNIEILIIENNSVEEKTFSYYDELERTYENIVVLRYQGVFNYSAINNYGVGFAKGEYLLLLNNDIEVLTPSWIEELLMFAQRNDVGCVGAKLLYPDNTIQHAGVIVGVGGVAGHSHKYFHRDDYGFMSRIQIAQNLSAVTAACLMVKKSDYLAVQGFDEKLRVAFNDVDFCLRVKEYLNKNNVYTPFAELYHHESKSRGVEDTEEKINRFNSEVDYFKSRWHLFLEQGDPCYNRNLTLEKENFDVL